MTCKPGPSDLLKWSYHCLIVTSRVSSQPLRALTPSTRLQFISATCPLPLPGEPFHISCCHTTSQRLASEFGFTNQWNDVLAYIGIRFPARFIFIAPRTTVRWLLALSPFLGESVSQNVFDFRANSWIRGKITLRCSCYL